MEMRSKELGFGICRSGQVVDHLALRELCMLLRLTDDCGDNTERDTINQAAGRWHGGERVYPCERAGMLGGRAVSFPRECLEGKAASRRSKALRRIDPRRIAPLSCGDRMR